MPRIRSIIWRYFTKTSDTRAECNFCSAELSFKGGATANLFRHIRLKHPSIYLDLRYMVESLNKETSEINPKPESCKGMKRIRSLIWSHFTKTSNIRAKCHICSAELSFKGGGTANLFRHVRLKHVDIHLEEETLRSNPDPFPYTIPKPEPLAPCKDTKRVRSLIWNHFTKTSDFRANCNFCSLELSFKGGATTNLFRHVRLKHADIHLEEETLRSKPEPTVLFPYTMVEPEPSPPPPFSENQKRVRSLIWSYFTKTSAFRAKCNICSVELSFKGGATTNLFQHVHLKHADIHLEEETSRSKPEPTVLFPYTMVEPDPSPPPCENQKRVRSLIWSHFTKTSAFRAKCNICSVELSFKGGATTNLFQHVHLKHADIHLEEETSRSKPEPTVLFPSTMPVSELPPPCEDTKRVRSLIWNHFTKTSDFRAKCNFCSVELSFKGGATTNLFRHLRLKHAYVPLEEESSKNNPKPIVLFSITMPEPEFELPEFCEGIKRIRSLIWSHFTKTSAFRAICNVCSAELSFKGGSTFNLRRHLRLKHPSIYLKGQTSKINTNPEAPCERINRTRSFIWSYFTKISDIKAECNICSAVLSFEGGSTFNLCQHMRLKHLSINLDEQKLRINPEPKLPVPFKTLSKIRSSIWNFFTKISGSRAECNFCSVVLSFKGGSTSNLFRHVRLKHLGSNLDEYTITNPEPTPRKGLARIRSSIWSHFTKTSGSRAECNFCSVTVSCQGRSTSNLFRHVRLKHPSISLTEQTSRIKSVPSYEEEIIQINPEEEVIIINPEEEYTLINPEEEDILTNPDVTDTKPHVVSGTNRADTSVSVPIQRVYELQHILDITPISSQKRLEIDFKLVKMLATDYQAFSIVESQQFQILLNMLNPSYVLPSRKTISNHLMPQLYAKVSDVIRTKLESASAVTVSTDEWTSISNESYVSVTIHYIDDECKMTSFLLDCFKYTGYTAQNVADELKGVLHAWNVENKVVAVVSDNASDITAAVHLCGWKHFPCYAHTLNIIVQTALKEIKSIQKKVKSIVKFVRYSSRATLKLKEMEEQMGFDELTLKDDVPTRWTSTYEMFSRILKVREPLLSTLALENFDQEQLSQSDWTVISECCKGLKNFLGITSDMSAEKHVIISKIIVYSNLLFQQCTNLSVENVPIEFQNMVRVIKDEIKTRFGNIEDDMLLAECTFLDPRFKEHGFEMDNSFDNAKHSIINMCELIPLMEDKLSTNSETIGQLLEKEEISIWDEYDRKVAEVRVLETVAESSIEEVNRYIQEPLLKRHENPLEWWESHKRVYPRLFKIVKKKLCVVATSMPCERIFSKSGRTVLEKRARLSDNKVSKLEFLNFNLNHLEI